MLPDFEFHTPDGFDALFRLKARFGADARYFSGGTALMLLMRSQLLQPQALLCVTNLPGMRGITRDDKVIRIGAAETHADLAASSLLRRDVPILPETFAHVATRRVRNVGTVGGNLAHANPHQDPPVTLMALGANVVALSSAGERRIPLDQFFRGYFENSLEEDEVLTGVEVPLPAPDAKAAFIKYLPRSADDYATINVAVVLQRRGGCARGARIVIGSMGPTPIRAREAEQILMAGEVSEDRIAEAGRAAAAVTDPELDSRGSPEFKKRIAPVIVARAISQAWRSP